MPSARLPGGSRSDSRFESRREGDSHRLRLREHWCNGPFRMRGLSAEENGDPSARMPSCKPGGRAPFGNPCEGFPPGIVRVAPGRPSRFTINCGFISILTVWRGESQMKRAAPNHRQTSGGRGNRGEDGRVGPVGCWAGTPCRPVAEFRFPPPKALLSP